MCLIDREDGVLCATDHGEDPPRRRHNSELSGGLVKVIDANKEKKMGVTNQGENLNITFSK